MASISSICGNNGSVKSTDTRADVESVNKNTTASSSSAPTTASVSASADTSSLSAHRVADYTTDPVDPNPSYNKTSAEVRVAEHIEALITVIKNVDTVMDKAEKDNKENSEQ